MRCVAKTLNSCVTWVALLAFGFFTPALPAQESRGDIDHLFSDYASGNVPGCALGVIEKGEWIYRKAYGQANLEYDLPLTTQSIFRTASVGKQFTAAAVALLAESGQISMDDSLAKYFPEFPAWAADITIEHLVFHTSGIRDYLDLAFLAGKGSDADNYTDQWAIAAMARQQETNFPPGTEHLYSNSGYLLLAHLVKRVTGQTLREYAAEHIFTPLGMKRTHYHDDHTEVVPLRAYGYAPKDDGFHVSMTTLDMVGDGGVFTSIDELLAWDQNFYRNRLGKGDPELITLLTTPATLKDGTSITYAYGLDIDQYRGQKLVSHTGSFVGFRSAILRFPDQQFSVIVLCNRADANPESLAMKASDLLLADVLEPKANGVDLPNFAMSPAELQKFSGDFWEAAEGIAAESRVIDGQLWAVHSPERRNVLRPIGPNRFQMMGTPAEVLVEFEMAGDEVKVLRRFINGATRGVFTPFDRLQLTPAELSAYAGEYFSPELDITYTLFVSEEKLWFNLEKVRPRSGREAGLGHDEGSQELTAMFGETFENPDYGAFTFTRNSSGEVDGFKLQSGRVRNLGFVRHECTVLSRTEGSRQISSP